MSQQRAPAGRDDQIAQLMIYDTRYLNRRATPRDAAEQFLGRRMADLEWEQHSALWLTNWSRVPDPRSIAEKLRRLIGRGFAPG